MPDGIANKDIKHKERQSPPLLESYLSYALSFFMYKMWYATRSVGSHTTLLKAEANYRIRIRLKSDR